MWDTTKWAITENNAVTLQLAKITRQGTQHAGGERAAPGPPGRPVQTAGAAGELPEAHGQEQPGPPEGLAEGLRWGPEHGLLPTLQVILMLTEKCHKQQQGMAEAKRLRVLLGQLEQDLLKQQQDNQALSIVPSQLWPVEDPSGRTGKQEKRKSVGNDYCEDIGITLESSQYK
uniref:Uncharacterized protein n=1 Tax=Rangifer tarandus platyrhynchus TaxID=3082113 RepID=A0ACB0DZ58_RANTA|nr:unnamed protein product [Rangifer tarandus platyrhynchus]